MGHDLQINDFFSFCFFKEKNAPKRQKVRLFHAIEIYGACRWIGNPIVPHFDLLKFEICSLEAKKIKFSNLDQITP